MARYFSYIGLENIDSEGIKYVRTRPDADPKIIAFDSSCWADSGPDINSLKTVAVDYRSLDNNEA